MTLKRIRITTYLQMLPLTVALFCLALTNALQCPKGYVQGTDDLEWAYCFTYFNEDASWQGADRRCNAITGIYNELDTQPGYLASIDDKGVNDVVQLHACNDSGVAGYPRGFWVGMSKGIKSGEWTWSDTNRRPGRIGN